MTNEQRILEILGHAASLGMNFTKISLPMNAYINLIKELGSRCEYVEFKDEFDQKATGIYFHGPLYNIIIASPAIKKTESSEEMREKDNGKIED